jgi:hypothetical protein
MTVLAGKNQTKDRNKSWNMRHLGVMRVHLFDTCPTHANQPFAERAKVQVSGKPKGPGATGN